MSGYRIPPGCCDEVFDSDGTPHPHAASLLATLERLGSEALDAAGRRRDTIFMQQGITFEIAGSDGERRDRRVAPRPRAADSDGHRVDHDQARSGPANPRPERVRRRRVPRPRDRPRWNRAVVADRQPTELRPAGPRRAGAGRRLLPRLRMRPRARWERPLAGARGQRAHAVGDLVRAREPGRDDAADARAVRGPPCASGRRLSVAAARGAPLGRTVRRRDGEHRRAGRPDR